MFQDKTIEELVRMAQEDKMKLQQFRFVMAGGKSKNVKEGKKLRKEIAQIETFLRQKKLALLQ